MPCVDHSSGKRGQSGLTYNRSTPMNGDIGAVPTFIGSGILFLASGTMVMTCVNAMFDKKNGVLIYRTTGARILRSLLKKFSTFLIISYALLFVTFFSHQYCKVMEITPNWFFAPFMNETPIYLMQIFLFPFAVLFASFLVRIYIYIRSEWAPKLGSITFYQK